MRTALNRNRSCFSLSNEEIIKLVDFIFTDYNLDRAIQCFLDRYPEQNRTLHSRKIEIIRCPYDWAYIVKVTFFFKNTNDPITTGFIIASKNEISEESLNPDFYIQSIASFFKPFINIVHEETIVEQFEVDVDFSVFILYYDRLFTFLDKDLNFWSKDLADIKYLPNKQIKDLLDGTIKIGFTLEDLSF